MSSRKSRLSYCLIRLSLSLSLLLALPMPSRSQPAAQPPNTQNPTPKTLSLEQQELRQLNSEGVKAAQKGDFPTALKTFQAGLEKARTHQDEFGTALFLNNIGLIYDSLGKYEQAIDFYQRALKLNERIGNQHETARVLTNIGVVYKSLGQFQKALDYHQRSLKLREKLDSQQDIAQSLGNIGVVYWSLGQYEQALDFQQRALKLREKTGSERDIASSLVNIGNIYDNLSQYEQALDFQQRALKIFEKIGNEQSIAISLMSAGNSYDGMGQYKNALDYYQRALKLFENIGNDQHIAISLTNIGNVYSDLGLQEKALEFQQRALKLLKNVGNEQDIAKSLNDIGRIYAALGQLEKALDFFRRAHKLFESSGNEQFIATSLGNIGSAYFSLGQYEQALEYHQRSHKLKEKIGNEQEIATSLTNIGNVYSSLKQFRRALDYHQRALTLYEKVGNEQDIAGNLNNIGNSYSFLRQYDQALDFYQRALKLKEKIGNEQDIALSLSNIGVVFWYQGQLGKAEDAFSRALHAFEEFTRHVVDPSQLGEAQQTLSHLYEHYAQVLLQLHRPEDALLKVERGRAQGLTRQLQLNRDDLTRLFNPQDAAELQARDTERRTARKLRQIARSRLAPAYPAKQQTLMRKIAEVDARYQEAERQYDLLRNALYAHYPEFLQIQGERQHTFAELKQLSRDHPDTRYLEFAVVNDETTLRFVLFNGQITASTLPIGNKQLKLLVADWRKALLARTDDEPKHARALYETLFSNLPDLTLNSRKGEKGKGRRGNSKSQHPTPNTHLVFVVNGPLLDIPFAALLDGTGKRLCERYAVSAAVSLGVFFWQQTRPNPTASLLCVADPMGKQESGPKRVSLTRGGFGALPFARAEGEAVAKLFPYSMTLIGPEARKARVRQEIGKYRFLHFATHGDLDTHNGLRSALVLAPEPEGSAEESFLEGREIVEMGLAAQLAVLSACQSGVGKESGGEGLIGLAWAFRAAGVPSVVVSQWKVEDEATAKLMVAFYKGLLAGKRKDEALQQAMLSVKKEKPQPYFWAAFQVIGETGALDLRRKVSRNGEGNSR